MNLSDYIQNVENPFDSLNAMAEKFKAIGNEFEKNAKFSGDVAGDIQKRGFAFSRQRSAQKAAMSKEKHLAREQAELTEKWDKETAGLRTLVEQVMATKFKELLDLHFPPILKELAYNVSKPSTTVTALYAKLDESTAYWGEGGGSSYSSYFRVVDLTEPNGSTNIGVTSGGTSASGNCGTLKINGDRADVLAVEETLSGDGTYYVWIHYWRYG